MNVVGKIFFLLTPAACLCLQVSYSQETETASTRLNYSPTLGSLAPNDTLRVAINYGNPNNATKDSSTGTLRGVAVDLARLFAEELGLLLILIPCPSVPAMVNALLSGECDIAFSFDPTLDSSIRFASTISFIEVENTFVVSPALSGGGVLAIDSSHFRISVAKDNSTDRFLTANLKHATIVRTETVSEALQLLEYGKVDAFAGSRQAAVSFVALRPSYRVLDENLFAAHLAVAVRNERSAVAAQLNKIIEEAVASGKINQYILRAGLVGARAPSPTK